MRHHYTQHLAPISNKLVFQSTHPFRSNCDLEPFISYNTFCISMALSWALDSLVSVAQPFPCELAKVSADIEQRLWSQSSQERDQLYCLLYDTEQVTSFLWASPK